MPHVILKELETPLARTIAEYTLLQRDLKTAYDAITLWFDKYAARKETLTAEEQLISQALFRDLLVLFVGCFDKSAPVSVAASDIYGAADNSLAYFQWLQDIRDSYAAHKFGPFRQCTVGVMVNEAGDIMGAGHAFRIYAGFVPGGKDDLLSMIQTAGRHVEKKIEDLVRELLQNAKAMPPAELASLKVAQTHDVEPHEIRTSRDKFRRAKP